MLGGEAVQPFTPRSDDELADAPARVGVTGWVHRSEASVEMLVPVEHEVGVMGVQQLPPGAGGRAFGAAGVGTVAVLGGLVELKVG